MNWFALSGRAEIYSAHSERRKTHKMSGGQDYVYCWEGRKASERQKNQERYRIGQLDND